MVAQDAQAKESKAKLHLLWLSRQLVVAREGRHVVFPLWLTRQQWLLEKGDSE